MSQSTQASSTLPTVAGIKAGNEERRASPSASRPAGSMTIATEGEGGLAYFHKMMAQGGPAETGEIHSHVTNTHPQHALAKPQTPINLFPICPSLASEIERHVSILFAIQVVEHYASRQGQFPAAAKVPATEVVALE